MKVKTRKASKRSQGLPRAVCNSIYLVFASVTRHMRGLGRDSYKVTKSTELNTGFGQRMFQISNRPPKNEKSYAAQGSPAGLSGWSTAVQVKIGALDCGFIPAVAHVEPSRERPQEESLSIQLDCPALANKNLKAFRPNQSVWSLL